MERRVLTDLCTPQQMGKDRPEGVECGDGGFGVSHVQCAICPPSIAQLLPVCVYLLSHSVCSDSLRFHGL